MSPIELSGWSAASLTMMTFVCRDMVRLRMLALGANAAFVAYGAMAALTPVLVLHLVLAPINLWRLVELRRLPFGGRVPALQDGPASVEPDGAATASAAGVAGAADHAARGESGATVAASPTLDPRGAVDGSRTGDADPGRDPVATAASPTPRPPPTMPSPQRPIRAGALPDTGSRSAAPHLAACASALRRRRDGPVDVRRTAPAARRAVRHAAAALPPTCR